MNPGQMIKQDLVIGVLPYLKMLPKLLLTWHRRWHEAAIQPRRAGAWTRGTKRAGMAGTDHWGSETVLVASGSSVS